MDLHTDYFEELGIPLVQSFDVIDEEFPIFDDTISSADESQLAAVDESLRWIIDELPTFPDLEFLVNDFISETKDSMTSYYDTDPPHLQTTDEVQTNTETLPTAEPPVEILTDTQNLDIQHNYNTRRACYKKKISNLIAQEKELLNRLKKNQQRPTPKEAPTPHGQWLHTKDWVHIHLLRFDIPIKKVPNYNPLMKPHRTRKARSKKPSTTSH
ncbi:unnamed protein product [Macrosiphum euphorbiae]|uniref:Uncharacterized protein n=1 Tax=Macrosiphum euphorbiae TaxID=13131 RepID=A0AAV0WRV4_9HEMI|nr:unnamed protein product [Macrosiphum euphorbiae]